MQIYSGSALYNTGQIKYNNRQEKNQPNHFCSFDNSHFIIPTNNTLSFLCRKNQIKPGLNRFSNIFQGITIPNNCYDMPNIHLCAKNFKKFTKENEEVLVEFIKECLKIGEFTGKNRVLAFKFLLFKSGMVKDSVLSTTEAIYDKLSLKENEITFFNQALNRGLQEQRNIVKSRKLFLKKLFPTVNFGIISSTPNDIRKINEIITYKQLLEKISSKNVLGTDKSIQDVIKIALNSDVFMLNTSFQKQRDIVECMFLPKDGKILSDSQIKKELDLFDDEFDELQEQGLSKVYLLVKFDKIDDMIYNYLSLFPEIDFTKLNIEGIKTEEQLVKNLSLYKLKFDMTIKEVIERTLESRSFDKCKDSKILRRIVKHIFLPEDGKVLSDYEISQKLDIPINDFEIFKEKAFSKLQIMPIITKNIKLLLWKKNMKLNDLAISIEYKDVATLSNMINKTRSIPDYVIERMAEVFGIDKYKMMGWDLASNYLKFPRTLEYAIKAREEKTGNELSLTANIEKALKLKKFKSIYTFCIKNDFDQGNFSKLMQGERFLSEENIIKGADALGLSKELMEGCRIADKPDKYLLEVLKAAWEELQPH